MVVETLVVNATKMACRLVLKVVPTATSATTIMPARIAYSRAVTPRSSRRKNLRNCRMLTPGLLRKSTFMVSPTSTCCTVTNTCGHSVLDNG